eukprot:EG_transcript_12296
MSGSPKSPSKLFDAAQDVITFSEGDIPFGAFHSFTPYAIHVDRRDYPTVEHYYQASKFGTCGFSDQVRLAPSPGVAVQLAGSRTDLVRMDWEEVKYDYLERAVYAKFQQHTELRDLLLSTGHAKLVEKRKPRSMAEGPQSEIPSEMLREVLQKVRQQLFVNAIAKLQQTLCQLPLGRLPLCPHGAQCGQLGDEAHKASLRHPCPKLKNCTNPSPWHLHQFFHSDDVRPPKAHGGLHMPAADVILKASSTVLTAPVLPHADANEVPVCKFLFDCKLLAIPGHAEKFLHPCPDGSGCRDLSLDHRGQWLHAESDLEWCPRGVDCPLLDDAFHVIKSRHPCPAGVVCNKLTPAHLECFTHTIPPCAAGSHCWQITFKDHQQQYSHPCSHGSRCTKQQHSAYHSRVWTHEPVSSVRPLSKTPSLPVIKASGKAEEKAA